ncbi:FAD dependent monooxygenase [Microdochium nivale]|nr:FAD dependent monooxygenase [Microdochium nivale]
MEAASPAARAFKVAIVGGGMTGLTAALHLDRLGIDFILLESYADITPEVGASLALYPNFQRVLDQLGVLDEVHAESSELCRISCRNLKGNIQFKHSIAQQIRAGTGGYGVATFKRSQLLRILHRNISQEGRRKIITGKKVKQIEPLAGDEGVLVHIDGDVAESFHVDVVIGADGINSVTRAEMWRLAEEAEAHIFKGDQGEDLETEFGCVFGLSRKTGDLEKDLSYQICSQDMTMGVFGGPNGEAYWFIFFKVPLAKGHANIPKWDAFDDPKSVEMCKKLSHAKLTETTTFGDVYANCHRITTQACPHHCLRTWNYGRIICLGDAVAKMNPFLGQGGAQGAESVVMLVDRLHEALQRHEAPVMGKAGITTAKTPAEESSEGANDMKSNLATSKPTTAEIERILASVSKERQPRVRALVDDSQQIVRISCWSGRLFHFVGKYITPWIPTWVIVAQALGPWKGAYLSKSLPQPLTKSA